MPVPKHAMKFLEIVERCSCRFDHPSAFIAKNILFEIEVLACGGHELPHASRLGRRDRLRVEC